MVVCYMGCALNPQLEDQDDSGSGHRSSVWDSGIHTANQGDALEIQLSEQDLTLNGFNSNKVNALEEGGQIVAPYLDNYSNPVEAPTMGKMNFFLGVGFR